MRTLVKLTLLMALCSTAWGATYYVCAATGSPCNAADANNGTSKTTTWLHIPGTSSFTGSYVHSAGDHIILRGGDTWHFTTGTPAMGGAWTWSNSGTNGNADYLGVDVTWYSGGSFARPILSMDNTITNSQPSSCSAADDGTSHMVVLNNDSYVTLDNIEFSGACGNDATMTGAYVSISGGTSLTISNSYFHGYTLGTGASVGGDTFAAIKGTTAFTNTGSTIGPKNVFDNSDGTFGNVCPVASCNGSQISAACATTAAPTTSNTCATMEAVIGDAYTVYQNVFIHVSNTIETGNTQILHDNLFDHVFEPLASNPHGNIFETINGIAGGTGSFYNNVMRHVSEGVTWWPQASTAYIFNNVWEDDQHNGGSANPNCVMLSPPGSSNVGVVITVSLYNNTVDPTCSGQAQAGNGGTPHWASGSSLTVENTHFIGWTSINSSGNWFTINSPSVGTITDNGGEIYQTLGVANGQGYTLSNDFSPTSPANATVGAGNNVTASCSTFSSDSALCSSTTKGVTEALGSGGLIAVYPGITAISRPGGASAWDAGAYEFAAPPASSPTGAFFSLNDGMSEFVGCGKESERTTGDLIW